MVGIQIKEEVHQTAKYSTELHLNWDLIQKEKKSNIDKTLFCSTITLDLLHKKVHKQNNIKHATFYCYLNFNHFCPELQPLMIWSHHQDDQIAGIHGFLFIGRGTSFPVNSTSCSGELIGSWHGMNWGNVLLVHSLDRSSAI